MQTMVRQNVPGESPAHGYIPVSEKNKVNANLLLGGGLPCSNGKTVLTNQQGENAKTYSMV